MIKVEAMVGGKNLSVQGMFLVFKYDEAVKEQVKVAGCKWNALSKAWGTSSLSILRKALEGQEFELSYDMATWFIENRAKYGEGNQEFIAISRKMISEMMVLPEDEVDAFIDEAK